MIGGEGHWAPSDSKAARSACWPTRGSGGGVGRFGRIRNNDVQCEDDVTSHYRQFSMQNRQAAAATIFRLDRDRQKRTTLRVSRRECVRRTGTRAKRECESHACAEVRAFEHDTCGHRAGGPAPDLLHGTCRLRRRSHLSATRRVGRWGNTPKLLQGRGCDYVEALGVRRVELARSKGGTLGGEGGRWEGEDSGIGRRRARGSKGGEAFVLADAPARMLVIRPIRVCCDLSWMTPILSASRPSLQPSLRGCPQCSVL